MMITRDESHSDLLLGIGEVFVVNFTAVADELDRSLGVTSDLVLDTKGGNVLEVNKEFFEELGRFDTERVSAILEISDSHLLHGIGEGL